MRGNFSTQGWRLARIGLLACLAWWWQSGSALAQDFGPASGSESLRLPEVVITGIDRSKIQRMIPKVEMTPELALIETTARDRAEALARRGDAAFLRQVRQAEDWYRQATAIDPSYADAYVRLGDAHRAQNKHVDAADAYRQALALNAALVDVRYRLGVLCEDHLQDADQALAQYRQYVEAGGPDPRVRIWIRNLTRQLAGDEPDTLTEE